ncbi:hypothetical protein HID58_007940, partial [Brassica napus]
TLKTHNVATNALFGQFKILNGFEIRISPAQQRSLCAGATQRKASYDESVATPYTGGDIKKSGELGKILTFPPMEPSQGIWSNHRSFFKKAGQSGPLPNATGRCLVFWPLPLGRKTNSGPLSKHGEPLRKPLGPHQNSGSIPMLPTTGLKHLGRTSGPLNSSGGHRKISGPLDYSELPEACPLVVILIFVMGFLSGGSSLERFTSSFLIVVAALFALVAALFFWNLSCERLGVTDFVGGYPDADLRTAKNGQYVKVTGVVTCGNVPLESSFHRVPRCVYTSTCLYEYRGWGSKPANAHTAASLGTEISRGLMIFRLREKNSGLRALVKSGNGAKVTPIVDDSVVIDFKPGNEQASPDFVRWLGQKNLSNDERVMRLKEEGSTVSVIGVCAEERKRVMIVPTTEPLAAGWQWSKCTFPASLEGIVLRCEDSSNVDAIPV